MNGALDLNDRIWHTAETAAEFAGCHVQTIREVCQSGKLRASKPFGSWRIHRDALDAWLGGVR